MLFNWTLLDYLCQLSLILAPGGNRAHELVIGGNVSKKKYKKSWYENANIHFHYIFTSLALLFLHFLIDKTVKSFSTSTSSTFRAGGAVAGGPLPFLLHFSPISFFLFLPLSPSCFVRFFFQIFSS